MRYTWGKAIREAATDCAVGMITNVPMNYVLISLAFYYELSALQTTVMFTTTFTMLAMIRKTTLRMWFDKRHHDHLENQASES